MSSLPPVFLPHSRPPHSLPEPEDAQEKLAPSDEHHEAFSQRLPPWYDEHRRAMPWRGAADPYRIWVAEVMLQQTRVEQATPYFRRFVDAFPTAEALAEADRDAVLKRWEGLGYYARARHLHEAARIVVDEHSGNVPGRSQIASHVSGTLPLCSSTTIRAASCRWRARA